MTPPLVSVVIPAYSGGRYLVEAVQSVLQQTYTNLEVIVVDDVSPNSIRELLAPVADPRLRIVVHDTNRGAVAARRTGVLASSGDIIAFLDEDDLFHPVKLQTHVTFLGNHPEIAVTYNARFDIEADDKEIRSIWQPPSSVTLAELVLAFPFSPSDTVIRRQWALQHDIWDQSYARRDGEMIFNGGEMVFGGRLALAGALFANVGRALNYRRYHARRTFKGLASRCQSERDCQTLILDDSRCPVNVRALRDEAFMNTYRVWAYYAFAQGETSVGQSFARDAARLVPSQVQGQLCPFVGFMIANVAVESADDLEEQLSSILSQFPPEFPSPPRQTERALAEANLIAASQATLFGRLAKGRQFFARAAARQATPSEPFIQQLTHQLLCYQHEFGDDATNEAIEALREELDRINLGKGRKLRACYSINRAFKSYRDGSYSNVSGEVATAIANDPRYAFNRGVISILLQSLVKSA